MNVGGLKGEQQVPQGLSQTARLRDDSVKGKKRKEPARCRRYETQKQDAATAGRQAEGPRHGGQAGATFKTKAEPISIALSEMTA
jgi:hypothetical protein